MRTIYWDDETSSVILIDQTKLPSEFVLEKCRSVNQLAEAIKVLKVRGAPALGVAGAYGVVLASYEAGGNTEEVKRYLIEKAEVLRNTRPTAVNLFYGIDRTLKSALKGESVDEIRELALKEAEKIAEEDVRINRMIGENGKKLIRDGDTVMTYCNAGRLACVDWGTALGVIRSAVEAGRDIKVIACETRPLNQGSRLTAWELMEDGIDVTLITDNMAGFVMKKGMVDLVMVGADRVVRYAVFNKIGTYSLSILADHHGIPFYVAVPTTTFDFEREEGDVVIEERSPDELKFFGEHQIAPLDVRVYNPAFDPTPLKYVTALITEKGIIHPPYERTIPEVLYEGKG